MNQPQALPAHLRDFTAEELATMGWHRAILGDATLETNEIIAHYTLVYNDADATVTATPVVRALSAAEIQVARGVPETVEFWQLRAALLDAGALNTIKSAINSLTGSAGERAKIIFDHRPRISRKHDITDRIQQALTYTDDQMDDLFIAAGKISE